MRGRIWPLGIYIPFCHMSYTFLEVNLSCALHFFCLLLRDSWRFWSTFTLQSPFFFLFFSSRFLFTCSFSNSIYFYYHLNLVSIAGVGGWQARPPVNGYIVFLEMTKVFYAKNNIKWSRRGHKREIKESDRQDIEKAFLYTVLVRVSEI